MNHAAPEIGADLVTGLLRDQHPDLAHLPVTLGARGWDSQLWCLGDELAVRLPWATEGSDGLRLKEYAWLPAIAPRLPLPVPVPRRLPRVSATLDGSPPGFRGAGRPRSRDPRGRDRGGPLTDQAEHFPVFSSRRPNGSWFHIRTPFRRSGRMPSPPAGSCSRTVRSTASIRPPRWHAHLDE